MDSGLLGQLNFLKAARFGGCMFCCFMCFCVCACCSVVVGPWPMAICFYVEIRVNWSWCSRSAVFFEGRQIWEVPVGHVTPAWIFCNSVYTSVVIYGTHTHTRYKNTCSLLPTAYCILPACCILRIAFSILAPFAQCMYITNKPT